jgi:hypothetical protein
VARCCYGEAQGLESLSLGVELTSMEIASTPPLAARTQTALEQKKELHIEVLLHREQK